MKLAYDQETDSVYVNLRSGPAQDSREIAPDVVADFDAEGWLTGLDIQHASTTIELDGIQIEGLTALAAIKRIA